MLVEGILVTGEDCALLLGKTADALRSCIPSEGRIAFVSIKYNYGLCRLWYL